jgi:excisionase family DNA binding protein
MASGRIKYNQFAFMSVRDVHRRLLTLDEVAELLALSRRTVERGVQAGEIPALQWSVLSGRMYGDPAVPLQPPKKRGVLRETFSDSERAQIIADGPDPESLLRDRCARSVSCSATGSARTRYGSSSSGTSTTTAAS